MASAWRSSMPAACNRLTAACVSSTRLFYELQLCRARRVDSFAITAAHPAVATAPRGTRLSPKEVSEKWDQI